MKRSLSITCFLLYLTVCKGQYIDYQEDYFKEKVRLEFFELKTDCAKYQIQKGVSNIHEKIELWSICKLDNGKRLIEIKSFKNDIYYEEIYFDINNLLRYAVETENYNPINSMNQVSWNCEYFFENGKLMTHISLGHGKTEKDDWDSQMILKMYRKRMEELDNMQ